MMSATPMELATRGRRQGAIAASAALSLVLMLSQGCGDDWTAYAGAGLADNTPMTAAGYDAPITITKGGTYTGHWRSTDRRVAAVKVLTGEPVIIENSDVTGPGDLIWANCNCAEGLHLTVRNTTGEGTDSGVLGAYRGNFVLAAGVTDLEVSHTTSTGVICSVALLDSQPTRLKIVNNVANNVQDHQSDGAGGVLVERNTGHTIILNNIIAPQGAEIAWNQFINEPGKGSVEDVISVYDSTGSAAAPIDVHDNYIQGATANIGQGYAGGGIITDGSVPGFVDIHANQVVSTQNYGIAIAAGHDVRIHDNRVISSGRTADGQWLGAPGFGWPTAYYIWNGGNYSNFRNNSITNNVGALIKLDAGGIPVRADMAARSTSTERNNVAENNTFPNLDGDYPTHADEVTELQAWQAKLKAASQTVGVSAQQ